MNFNLETQNSDFRMCKSNPHYIMRVEFPDLTHDGVWASLEKSSLKIVFQITQGFHGDALGAFQSFQSFEQKEAREWLDPYST